MILIIIIISAAAAATHFLHNIIRVHTEINCFFFLNFLIIHENVILISFKTVAIRSVLLFLLIPLSGLFVIRLLVVPSHKNGLSAVDLKSNNTIGKKNKIFSSITCATHEAQIYTDTRSVLITWID